MATPVHSVGSALAYGRCDHDYAAGPYKAIDSSYSLMGDAGWLHRHHHYVYVAMGRLGVA